MVDLGVCFDGVGLAVAGNLLGLFPSSTRIELAGAIGAMLQPRPVHVAADNESVIRKATTILSQNGPGRRQWRLQVDGDLWETFHELAQQRGVHSIAFTWTKGHASYRHLTQQLTNARNAVFNGYADAAADQGHRSARVSVGNEVLSYLATKHKRLIEIICAITRRIARVAAAANKLLEQKAASRAKHTFIDVPAIPSFPDPVFAIHLEFDAPPPLVDDAKAALQEAQVRVFWMRLFIHPLADAEHETGTTWLELFTLYSLKGGGESYDSRDGREHIRLTHAERFKRFQQRTRKLFRFASEASLPLTRPMLKRTSDNLLPLVPYGLLGKFSMLPFKLGLGDEVAIQLHAALCSYSAKVPSTSKVPKRLRSARFKAPRFAPWDHLINREWMDSAANRYVTKHRHGVQCNNTSSNTSNHLNQAFLLECPRCNAIVDSRQRNLYKNGKCNGLHCRSCSATTTSAKCYCTHGIEWIACHLCRPQGFLCCAISGSSMCNTSKRRHKIKKGEMVQAYKRRRTSQPVIFPPSPPPRVHDSRNCVSGSGPAILTTTRPREGEGDALISSVPCKKRHITNKPSFKRRLVFEPRPNLRAKINSFKDDLTAIG